MTSSGGARSLACGCRPPRSLRSIAGWRAGRAIRRSRMKRAAALERRGTPRAKTSCRRGHFGLSRYAGSGGEVMPFKCDQPAVPTVQQDDANVRITRWDFAPGAATGWHTHGWPYFVVMLTDAVMRVEADGVVSEIPRKAGDSYQRPAGV